MENGNFFKLTIKNGSFDADYSYVKQGDLSKAKRVGQYNKAEEI